MMMLIWLPTLFGVCQSITITQANYKPTEGSTCYNSGVNYVNYTLDTSIQCAAACKQERRCNGYRYLKKERVCILNGRKIYQPSTTTLMNFYELKNYCTNSMSDGIIISPISENLFLILYKAFKFDFVIGYKFNASLGDYYSVYTGAKLTTNHFPLSVHPTDRATNQCIKVVYQGPANFTWESLDCYEQTKTHFCELGPCKITTSDQSDRNSLMP